MELNRTSGLPAGQEEFLEKYGIRTDLAIEARDVIVEKEGPPEIPGVLVDNESRDTASICRVLIESELGARMMGKMKGRYSTIEAPALRQRNREIQEQVSQVLSEELGRFLKHLGIGDEDVVLVVGLGNWNATPDAVGPRVVGNLMVTRHLYNLSPPELRGGLRPVCAVAPGVLGLTGIETGEIVQGIVDKVGPSLVVCVDALASRSTHRVGTTIQLSDTGIHPGSGVGNRRFGITPDSLGVPVVAVGVPTVVHAITIVADGMALVAQEEQAAKEKGELGDPEPRFGVTRFRLDPEAILPRGAIPPATADDTTGLPAGQRGSAEAAPDASSPRLESPASGSTADKPSEVGPNSKRPGLPSLSPEMQSLFRQLLGPYMGSMIVTPKEIDTVVEDMSAVIAGGLNAAFHPSLDLSQVLEYLGS